MGCEKDKECYIPRRWWDSLKEEVNKAYFRNFERQQVLNFMEAIEKGSTIPEKVEETENAKE